MSSFDLCRGHKAIYAELEDVRCRCVQANDHLNQLHEDALLLENDRLKVEQNLALALSENNYVALQVATLETKRKRREFSLTTRRERRAIITRKNEIRKRVLLDLQSGLNNVMHDRRLYGIVYKDWRLRHGIEDVQRTHYHYHRDGSVSIKTVAGTRRRRHHRKKPHDYGYKAPPKLEPILVDTSLHSIYHKTYSAENTIEFNVSRTDMHESVPRHFHRKYKCWNGSCADDYSSDEDGQSPEELLARYPRSEYIFLDEVEYSNSLWPASRHCNNYLEEVPLSRSGRDESYTEKIGDVSAEELAFHYSALLVERAVDIARMKIEFA